MKQKINIESQRSCKQNFMNYKINFCRSLCCGGFKGAWPRFGEKLFFQF